MKIQKFKYNPSFRYKRKVKSAHKKGLIPSLKIDVSGRKLTKENATVDHIIPSNSSACLLDCKLDRIGY